MARENLLDKRRARTRHAHNEDRPIDRGCGLRPGDFDHRVLDGFNEGSDATAIVIALAVPRSVRLREEDEGFGVLVLTQKGSADGELKGGSIKRCGRRIRCEPAGGVQLSGIQLA